MRFASKQIGLEEVVQAHVEELLGKWICLEQAGQCFKIPSAYLYRILNDLPEQVRVSEPVYAKVRAQLMDSAQTENVNKIKPSAFHFINDGPYAELHELDGRGLEICLKLSIIITNELKARIGEGSFGQLVIAGKSTYGLILPIAPGIH